MRDGQRSAVEKPEDLVLLHGFAGTRHTWDRVRAHLPRERYRPLALDLPGHGSLAGREGPIDLQMAVESVLARSPSRFALCGYSLGGRLALRVALAAPERVSRLAVIASGPGIGGAAERRRRGTADRALAEEIETGSAARFAERWCEQQIFVGDPPSVRELARADYLRNDPRRLAAVLRGLGQGEMEPVWDRLGELAMPTAVVAGDRDAKYEAIARRMVDALPQGRLHVVAGGHRLPLQSPAAVAAALCRL